MFTVRLATLIAALALAAPAGAAAAPRCTATGGRTLARSGSVRIFRLSGRVYGCWLPTRRRTYLAPFEAQPNIDSGFSPDGTSVNEIAISGRFAGFFTTTYGDPQFWVDSPESVDIRSGHVLFAPDTATDDNGVGIISDLSVASDGALAYLQTQGAPCSTGNDNAQLSALIGVDRGGSRTLDCETPADPAGQGIAGVSLSGQTVTWTHAGTGHSATLR
jgi:hypothetical protein